MCVCCSQHICQSARLKHCFLQSSSVTFPLTHWTVNTYFVAVKLSDLPHFEPSLTANLNPSLNIFSLKYLQSVPVNIFCAQCSHKANKQLWPMTVASESTIWLEHTMMWLLSERCGKLCRASSLLASEATSTLLHLRLVSTLLQHLGAHKTDLGNTAAPFFGLKTPGLFCSVEGHERRPLETMTNISQS